MHHQPKSETMNNTETLITALANAPSIIIPLVHEVPSQNLKRRPSPNKWSAHEHACHLSDIDALYLARLELILAEPAPFIRAAFASLDEEAGALLKMDLAEALERYARERARLVTRLRALRPEDWQRTAQHEENYTQYSVFVMFRQLYLHEIFHAYRIEELMLKNDWPALVDQA